MDVGGIEASDRIERGACHPQVRRLRPSVALHVLALMEARHMTSKRSSRPGGRGRRQLHRARDQRRVLQATQQRLEPPWLRRAFGIDERVRSPTAAATPALRARARPGCGSATTRAPSRAATAAVPSVEALSTTITSKSPAVCASSDASRRGSAPAPLQAGITTDALTTRSPAAPRPRAPRTPAHRVRTPLAQVAAAGPPRCGARAGPPPMGSGAGTDGRASTTAGRDGPRAPRGPPHRASGNRSSGCAHRARLPAGPGPRPARPARSRPRGAADTCCPRTGRARAERLRRGSSDVCSAAMSAPPPGIFKAYDIRGTYPDELDRETAHQIGRAFVRVLANLAGKRASELRIGLGRDMRDPAPEMAGGYRGG